MEVSHELIVHERHPPSQGIGDASHDLQMTLYGR